MADADRRLPRERVAPSSENRLRAPSLPPALWHRIASRSSTLAAKTDEDLDRIHGCPGNDA